MGMTITPDCNVPIFYSSIVAAGAAAVFIEVATAATNVTIGASGSLLSIRAGALMNRGDGSVPIRGGATRVARCAVVLLCLSFIFCNDSGPFFILCFFYFQPARLGQEHLKQKKN